jgi:CMP-N,N'-diacetyllegionaminic acid synthase
MNVTALLTGRGNNTLKDKNVLPLNGHPLLHYPCSAANKTKLINEFYVSSECKTILFEASKFGFKNIIRPNELSSGIALHVDVLIHALEEMKKNSHIPDILVVLLANSPTLKSEWIDECINLILNDKSISSVVPVIKDQDKHPFRAKTLSEDGSLVSFFDFSFGVPTNRQELPDCYFLCHNFWVIRLDDGVLPEVGEQPWTFLGKKVLPYVVEESVDIHDLYDLERSSKWLEKNNISL